VRDNDFHGIFPESMGGWTKLEHFDAGGNGFTGSLPDSITSWTSLRELYLNNNGFTGQLPSSLEKWTDLRIIDLSNNAFTGTIPDSIAAWSSITNANFENNDFVGSVPLGICDAPKLMELWTDCNSEVDCSCCKHCDGCTENGSDSQSAGGAPGCATVFVTSDPSSLIQNANKRSRKQKSMHVTCS